MGAFTSFSSAPFDFIVSSIFVPLRYTYTSVTSVSVEGVERIMFLLTGCITTTRIHGKSGMRIAKDGVHDHFITLFACIPNSSIDLITLKCPS